MEETDKVKELNAKSIKLDSRILNLNFLITDMVRRRVEILNEKVRYEEFGSMEDTIEELRKLFIEWNKVVGLLKKKDVVNEW